MSKKSRPSPELLRELLRYEPETGKLFWLERPAEMFKDGYFSAESNARKWNAHYAGKEAFTADNGDGYLTGCIFDRKYRAHRVIWALETGSWPTNEVDHEDHDRSNNRWGNLCEASRAENSRNRSRHCTNTSGVTGVHWDKQTKKWRAVIKVDGSTIHLGYFDGLPSAITARAAAQIKYGFHENHGRKFNNQAGSRFRAAPGKGL